MSDQTTADETGTNPKKLSLVGGAIGAFVGSRRGRLGALVGGVVGGTLGYVAGSRLRGSPAEPEPQSDPVVVTVDDPETAEEDTA